MLQNAERDEIAPARSRSFCTGHSLKMKDHVRIFSVLTPGPSLRNVILVLERQNELVFVTDSNVWQVSCAGKLEHQFFDVAGR
jgi:hypothetical protein